MKHTHEQPQIDATFEELVFTKSLNQLSLVQICDKREIIKKQEVLQ